MYPTNIDIDIQTLLEGNNLSLPVHRSDSPAPEDQKGYQNGYIIWEALDESLLINSEGHLTKDGKQFQDFNLDVTVYADKNAKRKAAVDSVMDLLQPIVSNRRTILTSHTVGSTFFNYIRFVSPATYIYTIKTGQTTTEVSGVSLTFACRATI